MDELMLISGWKSSVGWPVTMGRRPMWGHRIQQTNERQQFPANI